MYDPASILVEQDFWVIGQNELVFNPKDKLNMSWIYEAHATQ